MMGTRGTPVQQADALDVISEWMELMKGAGKTLPAAVAQYKTAKEDAEAALARVEAVRAESARERADQKNRDAELTRRARQVSTDEAVIATDRETLRQGSEWMAREKAENDRLCAELTEKLAGIDGQRKVAQEEIRQAQVAAKTKIEAALDDSTRASRDALNAIDAQQRTAAREIADRRALVDAEIRERMARVTDREKKAVERETAAREHAAALAALAQE